MFVAFRRKLSLTTQPVHPLHVSACIRLRQRYRRSIRGSTELEAAEAALGLPAVLHQAAAAPLLPLPALPSWMPLGLAPRCRVRMLRLQGSTLRVKREDRPSMAAEEGAICRQNKLR